MNWGWTAGHTKLQPAYLPSEFTRLEVILLRSIAFKKLHPFLNTSKYNAPVLKLLYEIQERDVKNALRKFRRSLKVECSTRRLVESQEAVRCLWRGESVVRLRAHIFGASNWSVSVRKFIFTVKHFLQNWHNYLHNMKISAHPPPKKADHLRAKSGAEQEDLAEENDHALLVLKQGSRKDFCELCYFWRNWGG